MAHSYSRNHIHLIFSTKERRNFIPRDWQARLWAYIAGICKNYDCRCGGRYGKSCPCFVSSSPETFFGQGGSTIEREFIEMDGRAGNRLRLAGRIRSFQRQFIQSRSGGALRSQPSRTSPKIQLRGGISRASQETRCGITTPNIFWVRDARTCRWMCRPSGALGSLVWCSHRSRGGLRSFVPYGTDARLQKTPAEFVGDVSTNSLERWRAYFQTRLPNSE